MGDSHGQGRPHTPFPSPDTVCTLERLPTRQVNHKNDRNNENTHMYLSLDRSNRLLYLPLIFCTPSCGDSDARVKAFRRILRVPNGWHRGRCSGRGLSTRRPRGVQRMRNRLPTRNGNRCGRRLAHNDGGCSSSRPFPLPFSLLSSPTGCIVGPMPVDPTRRIPIEDLISGIRNHVGGWHLFVDRGQVVGVDILLKELNQEQGRDETSG